MSKRLIFMGMMVGASALFVGCGSSTTGGSSTTDGIFSEMDVADYLSNLNVNDQGNKYVLSEVLSAEDTNEQFTILKIAIYDSNYEQSMIEYRVNKAWNYPPAIKTIVSNIDYGARGSKYDVFRLTEYGSKYNVFDYTTVSIPANAYSVGIPYADVGIVAIDYEDGNVSASVKLLGGPVNTAINSTYLLQYIVEDKSGNQSILPYKVIVGDGGSGVDNLYGNELHNGYYNKIDYIYMDNFMYVDAYSTSRSDHPDTMASQIKTSVVDEDGNVYMAGLTFSEAKTEYSPAGGISKDDDDISIIKMDKNGKNIWRKKIQGIHRGPTVAYPYTIEEGREHLSSMVLGKDGYIYMLGYTHSSGGLMSDTGQKWENIRSGGILIKMDLTGNIVWIKNTSRGIGTMQYQTPNYDGIHMGENGIMYLFDDKGIISSIDSDGNENLLYMDTKADVKIKIKSILVDSQSNIYRATCRFQQKFDY